MLQGIIVIILLGIVVYLICDKKGIKIDDIKLFFKNVGVNAKEKFSIFFDKTKDFFKSVKRNTSENPENLPSVIETSDNDNESTNESSKIEEETIAESNQESSINKERLVKIIGLLVKIGFCIGLILIWPLAWRVFVDELDLGFLFYTLAFLALFIYLMIKFRWFRRLMLVVLILCICITPFVYKKIRLDYDGKYATERIVYTEEYDFCMLITYYPAYHSGDSKGFAVTNIPFGALFSEEFQRKIDAWYNLRYYIGNDSAITDSKEMLDSYQMLATLGDNALVDSLAKLFLDSKKSTRSIQIGKYGNYFATKFDDFISKSNSKNSYEETDAKDLLSDSVEEDYSPILIRP